VRTGPIAFMDMGPEMHAYNQLSSPCVRLKVVDPPLGSLPNLPVHLAELRCGVAIGTERGPGLMGGQP
jgi:hypothetical protein